MLQQPQQGLADAAQLQDLGEDQLDRSLHAPVRILLQPVANLDEADRRGDQQLAAPCLLVARSQRALTQQIELVLVQAALQAEQQAIVALPSAQEQTKIHPSLPAHAPLPRRQPYRGADRMNLLNASVQ